MLRQRQQKRRSKESGGNGHVFFVHRQHSLFKDLGSITQATFVPVKKASNINDPKDSGVRIHDSFDGHLAGLPEMARASLRTLLVITTVKPRAL